MTAAVKLDISRDRRCSPRRTVIEDAWIIDKRGGWSLIDCTVRDISAGGAKIEIDASLALPACFDLLLEKELKIIPVRIRWRRRNFMGVEFMGEPRRAQPFRLC
jgi:hypothetical protein